MPEEISNIFEEIMKEMKPLSLDLKKEAEEALKECNLYFEGNIEEISSLQPLSIYYILSKLDTKKQIDFIKDNIKILRENEEDIFLNNVWEPKPLSYYFSYETISFLYDLDFSLFEHMMQGEIEYIFYNFNHEDFLHFFEKCKPFLLKFESRKLILIIRKHNRGFYKHIGIEELRNYVEVQPKYNKEFMTYFIENYKDKIEDFLPNELLNFISCIEDITEYEKWVLENKIKIKQALTEISDYDLREFLSEYTTPRMQQILFSNFLEELAKKHDIYKMLTVVPIQIIVELYFQNKEIFSKMMLKDWIKLNAQMNEFPDSFKKVLDDYEIKDIEDLFDVDFYTNNYYYSNSNALRYIELKYRQNLEENCLIPITSISTIFSEEYFKNLNYLQKCIKTNILTKESKEYKENLVMFIKYLKEHNLVLELSAKHLQVIDQFFYKIVKGKSITSIFEIKCIEDMALINRLGTKEWDASDFTVEQIEKFNVKEYKQLLSYFEKKVVLKNDRRLVLKLYFLIGFTKAKKIIEMEETLTLEHLVGNVDVKHVQLNKEHKPILNKKIMNILFSNPNGVNSLLIDKTNEVYTYFPRIFNEWEIIELNHRDKNLHMILEFLKGDTITLTPNYYRLKRIFKWIGCKNKTVEETLKLHEEILKRTISTIPKVKNQIGEYTYEILDLQDMNGLIVGNKTNCCFTVLGIGYSCLKHAMTSVNGRILVIKKNGELLAHSWVWRNGNMVCLDNVEASKGLKSISFIEVYLAFANEIVEKSILNEGIDNCIKNVTIGFTSSDVNIFGLENFPCYFQENMNIETNSLGKKLGKDRRKLSTLPQPIEQVSYSDSKNVQVLIKGSGDFKFYQSLPIYKDERKEVLEYHENNENAKDKIEEMNQRINALRYQNFKNNSTPSFQLISVEEYQYASCNNDWYILNSEEKYETFINENDDRAQEEMNKYQNKEEMSRLRKKVVKTK